MVRNTLTMAIETSEAHSEFSVRESNQTTTAWLWRGAMNHSVNTVSELESSHVTTWGALGGVTNQSTSNIPENCLVFDSAKSFAHWNHPGNLISWQTEDMINRVLGGIIIPFFFLLGAPGNMVSMVVFYKQGLGNRSNVCLFCLAVVDCFYITALFLIYVEHVYMSFTTKERHGKVYIFFMNNNLLFVYGFRFGSMLLSTVIAAERCVCVLFPLRAKHCISTRVFACIVVLATFAVSLVRGFVLAKYTMICVYELAIDRKSWQITFNAYFYQNRAMLTVLDGVFYGFIISMGCPIVVLLATVITAVKLRQIVRWRSHTATTMSSTKEIGLTRMLIALSVEFLVLSLPVLILRVTRLFPSVLDSYYHSNLYKVIEHGSTLCATVSGSVNFIVYYATGTRYRETLHGLLGIRSADQKSAHVSTQQTAPEATHSHH